MAAGTEERHRPWLDAGWAWVRGHLNVVLAVLVAGGLLAYVVNIAVTPKSGGQFLQVLRDTWWIVLLLTIPNLVVRAYVWRYLLHELGLRVPWRPLLVSFAAGEMTKVFPAGIYVENALLARLEHFRADGTVRSTAATTAMLGIESFVAVPVLLVLSLPGYSWLRLLIVAVVGAWVLLLALVWLLIHFWKHHIGPGAPAWIRRGVEIAEKFFEVGASLVNWRTLVAVLPTAVYLFLYAVALHAIAQAAGAHSFSYLDAIAVYAFIVLTVILIPVPTEIGLTEFGGYAALLAFNIPGPSAALIMLSMRALFTGMTILVAGTAMLLLRSELSEAVS
jgi:uncharacterized membrane protein YbhN (UPF0104 family)